MTDQRLQRSVVSAQEDEELGSANGAGQYDINGLIVTFSLNAEVERNGKGEGDFTIYADEGGGLVVDFEGKVTCLAIDDLLVLLQVLKNELLRSGEWLMSEAHGDISAAL